MQITPLTTKLLEQHYDSYLATLATLSPVGKHTPESLTACLERMHEQGIQVFVALDDDTQKIIWTVSVLIEHKMNRWWSRAGHLEDLAVHPDAQGQWVGSALMRQAISFAQEQWCYKLILDADKDPAHVTYYEKFWFTNEGAFMKISLL